MNQNITSKVQLSEKKIRYLNVDNIPISSEAILAIDLIKNTNVLLWIANDNHHMEMLFQSINTLKESDQLVHLYKPYDRDPAEVAQHYHLVNKLSKNYSLIIISCEQYIHHKLPEKDSINENLKTLKIGTNINQNEIIDWHFANGFEHQIEVYTKGDCAHRGAIFDCWPANSDYPVRIEFFDDIVESIRLFDSQTQCTLKKISSIQIPSLTSKSNGKTNLRDLLESNFIIINDPHPKTDCGQQLMVQD